YAAEDAQLFEEVMASKRPTPGTKGIDVGDWEPVLQKALALSPGDRWKTASELLAALEANLGRTAAGAFPRDPAAAPSASDRSVAPEKPLSSLVLSLPARRPSKNGKPAAKRSMLLWSIGAAVSLGAAIGGVLGLRTHHAPAVEPPQVEEPRKPIAYPASVPQVIPLPQPTSSAPANGEPSIPDSRKLLGILTVGDRKWADVSSSTDRPYKSPSTDRHEVRERTSVKMARSLNDERINQQDRPDTRAECTMSVNSIPWAEVWIDGQKTSQYTPVVDYKTTCGRHRLLFKRPDLHIYQGEDVDLKPGQPFKQRFVLAN
ncbi:MAG TPA: hypothetical protein VLA79_20740, partial [Polyangia bacterium]|nr:hypothetical protein [Polyangia bacterium]